MENRGLTENNFKMPMSSERGFTLIELMLSCLLFTILSGSVFIVMAMSNDIFRTNGLYAQVSQGGMGTLRYISREVGQTSPNATPSHLNLTTDGNGNSVVRFQIPVDWDNDGDADTGGLNPQAEWGAYDDVGTITNGRLGAWTRYYVQNNQLLRDVVDAALNPIAGSSRVVASNVQNFSASQSTSTLTMAITLRVTDTIGQKGGQARNVQQTFSSTTILRNAVN